MLKYHKLFPENEIMYTTDSEISYGPASSLSTSSYTNSIQFSEPTTSFNPKKRTHTYTPPIVKPVKKITPEMDKFAKYRKNKDDKLDRDLTVMSNEVSAAMKTVMSWSEDNQNAYMVPIKHGLKYVPEKDKTQCLIEMLQIIQKLSVFENAFS